MSKSRSLMGVHKKVPWYSVKVSILLWGFLMYSGRSSMSKSRSLMGVHKKVPWYSVKVSVLLWGFLMYSGRSSMSKSPVINEGT